MMAAIVEPFVYFFLTPFGSDRGRQRIQMTSTWAGASLWVNIAAKGTVLYSGRTPERSGHWMVLVMEGGAEACSRQTQ